MRSSTVTWTWRHTGLGWSVLERTTKEGVYVAFHWADGGGYVRSVGTWRLGEHRRLVAVVEAAEA